MKYVKLRVYSDVKSTDIFTMAVKFSPPNQGVSIEEMRRRVRVLDAFEANKDPVGITLEDADHETLVQALKSVPWTVSSKEVLTIVDDALDAKAPPVVHAAKAKEKASA